MPRLKIIDLSPASVKSSLRALSQNQTPRIIEPILADVLLGYWENGFPTLPDNAKLPAKARGARA